MQGIGGAMVNLSDLSSPLMNLETLLITMVWNLDNLSCEFFLYGYFMHVPCIDPM